MINVHDEWIDPALADVEFDLMGGPVDGNAMNLMGYTRAVLKRAGNPKEVLTAFSNEAMSGDYDHVIQTCLTYGGEL